MRLLAALLVLLLGSTVTAQAGGPLPAAALTSPVDMPDGMSAYSVAINGTTVRAWIEQGGATVEVELEFYHRIVIPSAFAFGGKLTYTYTDHLDGEITVTVTYTGSPKQGADKLKKAVAAVQAIWPPAPQQ